MANRCMECGVKRVPCPCEEEQKHIDAAAARAVVAAVKVLRGER